MPLVDGNFKQITQALFNIPIESKQSKSYLRSPLRYPGGKSRAVVQILELLPQELDALCSPFFGGGSVELACASSGVEVSGYDAFEPLVNFWQVLLEDAEALAKLVEEYHPLSRSRFYSLQKHYFGISERTQKAAAFFALNRSSYSGTTLSGGMSLGHKRFTESAIERLANFGIDNLTVKHADFRESIPDNPDTFLYLDPPYANGEKLYGDRGDMHENFDHIALANLLRDRSGWVLSYNDCEMIRDLYRDNIFVEAEWAYGMNNTRLSNEVIVLSRDYIQVS